MSATGFDGNSADISGGAVDGATLTLEDNQFLANSALGGGAIDVQSFAEATEISIFNTTKRQIAGWCHPC